jgi:Lysylphosphatidylglycerol synthase TM region
MRLRTAALLQRARTASASPRARRSYQVGTAVLGLGLAVPIGLKLAHQPFPIHRGNVGLVLGAAGILLAAGLLKARGWSLLFARHERPATLALAAAGGGASVSGLALPGRFDEVVRIAIVRRYGSPSGVKRLMLSLLVLGLVDAAALTPIALAGTAVPGQSAGLRTGLAVLAAVGLGAAALVVLLPRMLDAQGVSRFRLARWLQPGHIPIPRLSAAWGLVFASWSLRAVALMVVVAALGLGWSPVLAILLLCASSAAAAIPIGPGGAATQVGAGAAVLVAANVGSEKALGVAVTAQTLGMICGAALLIVAVGWRLRGVATTRLSPSR